MNIETLIGRNAAIVYDREVVTDPDPSLFEADHWAGAGRVDGLAPGRGTAMFIEAPFGAAVLRRYHRGGWAARISSDRYLYTGWRRSRPFREFSLLARMVDAGLPVPPPLAALCSRSGLAYQGALLTSRIPESQTLADQLAGEVSRDTWTAVGRCIRRFHDAGVHHADLNARNILLQEEVGQVSLVDFDRGKMTPGRPVNGHGNLSRLYRSLRKFTAGEALERGWRTLLEAYHG